MKIKICLGISIALNVILLTFIGIYMFTGLLDFKVLSKSIPRMCEYLKENNQEGYNNALFCNPGNQK